MQRWCVGPARQWLGILQINLLKDQFSSKQFESTNLWTQFPPETFGRIPPSWLPLLQRFLSGPSDTWLFMCCLQKIGRLSICFESCQLLVAVRTVTEYCIGEPMCGVLSLKSESGGASREDEASEWFSLVGLSALSTLQSFDTVSWGTWMIGRHPACNSLL